jgi:hypothetical protein
MLPTLTVCEDGNGITAAVAMMPYQVSYISLQQGGIAVFQDFKSSRRDRAVLLDVIQMVCAVFTDDEKKVRSVSESLFA